MKLCPNCKAVKEDKEFHTRSDRSGQLQSSCKLCAHKRSRKWAVEHYSRRLEIQRKSAEKLRFSGRDKREDARLKRDFGITLEFFDEMLLAQGGQCAICQKESKLCVDHNHETGKVRGLLCAGCNQALGLLKDSPSSARSAAEYLEKN